MDRPQLPVSLFEEGRNCCSAAMTERGAVLIDAEVYFEAFMRACERAQRSITILCWDFDSRTPLKFDSQGNVELTLGDFLNELCRRRRRLHIRVLNWDYPVIFGTDREFSPLYGLTWHPHRRIHFHYDNTHPIGGSHHQKIVVIDEKMAFVGGFDLTSRRWDSRAHHAEDARRTAGGKDYPPFHDMMIAVDGDAAKIVANVARSRWKRAVHENIKPVTVPTDPWPDTLKPQFRNVRVGVACTSPASGTEAGVRDVEALYLDMIARAKRYIYIENQYFTSQKIGQALLKRLEEPNGPEIVLVTRLLSHGWLEEITMHVLRTKLVKDLRAADHGKRFQVYYPHIDKLKEGTCIDVHSKMMIVDDEWLRVGSSNISNRSMGLDTECDVTIEANGDAQVMKTIQRIRDDLIAEHSGTTVEEVQTQIAAHGSMIAAIEQFPPGAHCLKTLEDNHEWSDALLATVSLADPERPVSVESLVDQFKPDVELPKGKSMWFKVMVAVLAAVALTLTWRYTPLAEIITPSNVTDWAEEVRRTWWAPIVLLLAYTPASFLMFPRPLITLAAVVAFGAWAGFAISMSGVVLAASSHYLLGRLMRRDTVRRMAGEKLNRMTYVLKKHGLFAMTAIRLIPVAPFVVEGLVAGAVRVKFWHLALGTFLGMLPGVLTTTVFADQVQAAFEDISTINWGLVAGVLVFFAVTIFFVRRWFNNEAALQGMSHGQRT